MANRVLVGDRNGTMGMWVSRPGYNVLTAADADMLFVASSVLNTKSFQTVQSGYFELGTNQSIDISFPYIGILPVVMAWCAEKITNPYNAQQQVAVLALEPSYLSATVVRLTARNPYGSYYSGFRYVITNLSLY